jgi:anaerobic magnesium-protoporphyrin IX monomethyl ester cyclase
MDVALVNPRSPSPSTGRGLGSQTPLGLLAIGGSVRKAGHRARLIDADPEQLADAEIAALLRRSRPDLVMLGHSASTPAHPGCMALAGAIRAALPRTPIVYGGVFPSFNAAAILAREPAVDIVVRGEGEAATVDLLDALAAGRALESVRGIAFRGDRGIVETPPAPPIEDLDAWPADYDLVEDWDRYTCWGRGRAAIVQFSRGCPHLCSYCGQRVFWQRWRRRSPEAVAAEIARLHRLHDVRFFDFADENPAASKALWRDLLERIAALGLPIGLFASLRAGDVVRDADILPLYKRAGFAGVILGIESTDPATLSRIVKGSTTTDDREAVRLLRRHGIVVMVGHVVGFEEDSWRTYRAALRQLLAYDPDLVNAMYATPHPWTAFAAECAGRRVIEPDLTKWDYRHQVLETRRLRAWQAFALVKLIDLAMHLRPKVLRRLLAHPDPAVRRDLRWCLTRAGRVWFADIAEFATRRRFNGPPPTLARFFADRFAPPGGADSGNAAGPPPPDRAAAE